MAIKYLSKAPASKLRGTALLRLDFNTKDDWRMKAVLPTVRSLIKTAEKVVVMSHRGRPEDIKFKNGIPSGYKADLSLKKDAEMLSHLSGRKVVFIPHFRFPDIRQQVAEAPRGSMFLLENLRFVKGEETNDKGFAKELASLGDFYVNDAFAVSHRANASVEAITRFLPSYAGIELEREIVSLSKAMIHPKRPLTLILGGAKAADKLSVITFFKNKADLFLLGGGPANTLLWLKGMDVKRSIKDRDPKDLQQLRAIARWKNIALPEDFVWHDDMIWDFGPKTIKAFSKSIATSRTILWSGPISFIERRKYARGSILIARAIIKNRRAFSIAGGGETVMFLKQYGLDKKFSFISTGGGAMIDFLGGKKLPGIEALK